MPSFYKRLGRYCRWIFVNLPLLSIFNDYTMTAASLYRSFLIFIAVFLLCSMSSAIAQTANRSPLYYLGIFGAYNLNSHTADFGELPGFTSCCPQFTSGSGNGLAAGLVGEIPLNNVLRLQIRPAFSNISGVLITPETIGNALVRRNTAPFDTISTPVTVEHRLASTFYTIGLEPTLAINIVDGLIAHVGLSFAYLFNAKADVRETITAPLSATFLDGRAFRNDKTGNIANASSLLFSSIIGLSYELPIGGSKFLRPDARYFLPFVNMSDVPWKANTLQVGAGITFAVYPPEKIRYERDTVYLRDTSTKFTAGINQARITRIRSNTQIETIREGSVELRRTTITENYLHEIPRQSIFSAAITAVGIEADGTRQQQPTIRIEEIETEEEFPLLPYIFFSPNSGRLDKTGMILLDMQRARQFKEENLPHNTLGIYSQMLNIIGSRLRSHPNAQLVIIGASNTIGEDGRAEIVSSRAAELQQYFEHVWGIDPSRISKKTRGLPEKAANNSIDDGREENRRAELYSDDPEIFRPVSLREIERKTTPPRIEIQPIVQSDTIISKWNINVEQSGEKLREYSGSSMPGIQSWNVEIMPQPKFETPVNIVLNVRNERGEEQNARTSLKVQQLTLRKKRYELKNDVRIERFALIVFDFNSAEIGPVNRKTLENIQSHITPESRVTIAGYADRTGELSYNSDLARRRCIETQKFLDLPDSRVIILPIGSTSLLYDNSTPQGRSYSRTVQITVETPVRE